MMQVAGEHQLDVGLRRREHRPDEEVRRVVRAGIPGRLDPARCRRTQDDLVARLDLRRDLVEVVELRLVDVRAELRINREQPPPSRQPDGEVTTGLPAAPAADLFSTVASEQSQEGTEPVVPVVVARQRIQRGRALRRRVRQRGLVRPDRLVVITAAGGRRIDLVAAHHQEMTTRQLRAVDLERVLGQQIRHRVRRVEAVAEIRDVVEPHLGVVDRTRPLIGDLVGQGALQLALVQELAEHARQQDLDRGRDEHRRAQPVHRMLWLESELSGVHRCGPASRRLRRPRRRWLRCALLRRRTHGGHEMPR